MSMTEVWRQYEQGVDYKTRIGLYRTVDLNERFYAGDQWVGVPHEGLPTPVVNFIKYASAWKIAAVTERRLGMQFFADGLSDGGDIGVYAKQISAYCDMLWERLKMDYITKEGLKQAAITGDYVQYFYWDSSLETGQAVTGDIATQLIDNVNYYPGNPNTPDVQSQPYIILAFREMTDKVREEARRNGCGNVDEIVSDEETEYTAGDRGKVEMDGDGKCNVLLKMYKKDGSVWCEKSVHNAVVQPAKDTRLKRYPVALMNWETRKNCCHGVAEVTGLIPNQVYVNKIMALSQLSQMQMSFPKVVYDRTRIREWTNRVAGAIPVNGDIGGAAQYLSPPGVAYDAWKGLDATLDKTMRMMGANDVTLGSIKNPDNTSAFIAARDAAMVPLQSHQERFYAFVEDIGLIWLDFIRNYYKGGRMIPVVDGGRRLFVPLPEDVLNEYAMRLKVEVGPSTMWSEIQVLQTLDNLLKGGKITLKQYLERLPDGHIPMKQELLDETARVDKESGQKSAGSKESSIAAAFTMSGPELAQAVGPAAEQAGGGTMGKTAAAQMNASGQQGAGQMTQVLKLVQAGVQSSDVKPEAAQMIGKLVQAGAGTAEILTAIKNAAAQGMVSKRFLMALARDMGGAFNTPAAGMNFGTAGQAQAAGIAPGAQMIAGVAVPPGNMAAKAIPGTGGVSQGVAAAGIAEHQEISKKVAPGTRFGALLELLRAGAARGGVKPEAAQALTALVQAGADSTWIAGAIRNAAAKGQITKAFAAKAQQALNTATAQRAVLPKPKMKRKVEKSMDMATGTQAAVQGMSAPAVAAPQPGVVKRQYDSKALLEALMELLKEGVSSGDTDADVPEAINKVIGFGADIAEVLEALKQAAEAGKVSPLLIARAEKLLGAATAGADEATDRSQILRYNKNMLTR